MVADVLRLIAAKESSSAVLALDALSSRTREEVRVTLLNAAVIRHPQSPSLRLRLAKQQASSGQLVAARETLSSTARLRLNESQLIEAFQIALTVGDLELLEWTIERLRASPKTTSDALAESLDKTIAVLEAMQAPDGSNTSIPPDIDAALLKSIVRGLIETGRVKHLANLLRAMSSRNLDRWSARHAAVALRRSGDLTLSTQLAGRVLAEVPDDGVAERLREVGQSSLQVLRHGWTPPIPSPQLYKPIEKSVGYLLHNSLPYASAGYATRTHGLLTALVKQGWDVHGMTRLGYPLDQRTYQGGDPAPLEQIDGVLYHRLLDGRRDYPKWPLERYLSQYADGVEALARRQRLSVVHGASNYWNGLAAAVAGRRLGVPSIYEVRGLWELTRLSREPEYAESEMYHLTAKLEAQACMAVDHVLAITSALRDEMVSRGVPAEKITILPNGVDATRFVPRARDELLADQLGLSSKVVIGYVGSILDYEGIDTLLHGVADLRQRRNDFHVLIVGGGAAAAEMQGLSRRLGLQNDVTFTGRVAHEEVERYYSLVDVAPFPRKPLPVCEIVSPLKPFEAMAMGKTVIVSDVAALTEIVRSGETGLVFRKGDHIDLSRALEAAVANPSERARLGNAARSWVEEKRDWNALVSILQDVYAAVLSN